MTSKANSNLAPALNKRLSPLYLLLGLLLALCLTMCTPIEVAAQSKVTFKVDKLKPIQLYLNDFPRADHGQGIVRYKDNKAKMEMMSAVDWYRDPRDQSVVIMVHVAGGKKRPLISLDKFTALGFPFMGHGQIHTDTYSPGKWTYVPTLKWPI